MAGTSSIWPLHVAIAAAINGDVTLAALLAGDRVYSLTAPRSAPFDYIVLAGSSAQDFPTFSRAGERGVITLDAWTVGDDQMTQLQMYGEARRVLHNVVLALVGTTQKHCLGQLALATTISDPSGEYLHGVWRYSFTTL